jgi:acetyl esterase/lipase
MVARGYRSDIRPVHKSKWKANRVIFHQISDWSDAYANAPNIPGGERWPAAWVQPAQAYRDALQASGRATLDIPYGERARNLFDLFAPEGRPKGLVVFVHGGFWKALDKSFWSHLARGSVESGYAVAMPSYTLCPTVRISEITREIAAAVARAAAMVEGPLFLTGHSAGGHLVTRMISATSPLLGDVRARISHTVSISGVHDLRPLMKAAMNAELWIDEAEARVESPALLEPSPSARVTCWVGSAERPEFVRQNALLANIWTGLGAKTCIIEEPGRHHFDVIDGLADPDHQLTRTLLSP